MKRHRGPSGYHDEVFHDDEHVVRTLTKILDDASHRPPQARPDRGPPGRPARRRRPPPHRARRPQPRRPPDGEHPEVHRRRRSAASTSSCDRDTLDRSTVAAFLPSRVRGAPVDRVRRRARLGQDDAAVAAAPPSSTRRCASSSPRRSSRPTSRWRTSRACRPAPARADRAAIDLRRLVAGFLRMAPDVAIVGEVRDREALPLLLTLSSGVKGFTTIHAGSARQALTRLRFVCQLADTPRRSRCRALNTLVTEAVDLVVHCARTPARPRVTEIIAVEDLAGGADATPVHDHRRVRPARPRRAARVDRATSRSGPPGRFATPGSTSLDAPRATPRATGDDRRSPCSGWRWRPPAVRRAPALRPPGSRTAHPRRRTRSGAAGAPAARRLARPRPASTTSPPASSLGVMAVARSSSVPLVGLARVRRCRCRRWSPAPSPPRCPPGVVPPAPGQPPGARPPGGVADG